MSKSFTTMEKKMCLVTGKEYRTGNLFINKRLREKYDMETLMGWGFSPKVQEKFDEGYIALVGIDPDKSEAEPDGTVKPQNAYRTGSMCYLRKTAAEQMFDVKVDQFAFVDEELINHLETMQKNSEDE